MQMIPYFYFNGNANEAIEFYREVFKAGPVNLMKYKDQPYPGMPEEHAEMILHAEIVFGNNTIYVSDAVGERKVKVGDNVQVNLNCNTEPEIHIIYEQLKEGGVVRMPLQDTFWGAVFGSLTDRFGITWSLNYMKK